MVGGVNVQPPGSNLRERRGNGHRSEHYTAPEPADPELKPPGSLNHPLPREIHVEA